MTKDEFVKWAIGRGYALDRWGHLHRIREDGTEMRWKVQARSVRLEKAYTIPAGQYSPAVKRWLKIYGGYLSQLSIVDGKLKGATR